MTSMWQTTFFQSIISLSCSLILGIFLYPKTQAVGVSFLGMALLNSLFLSVLLLTGKSKNTNIASVVFLANILVAVVAISFNHFQWIQQEKPFEVFFGFKIIAITVALLAPANKWVGWSTMFILLSTPILLYNISATELMPFLNIQEPWFTITWILTCCFIYYQRLKIFNLIRAQAARQAADAELKKFANLLMGAQHLVNTPLQVIETATELIRIQHPETRHLVSKIEISFVPIRRVWGLLSFGAAELKWEEVNMALSIEALEEELARLKSHKEH